MSVADLKAQVMAEYDAAKAELDAKFKPMIDAIAAFGNTTSTKSTRGRKRKTAAQQTAANDTGDTTILPPPNTQTTDDEEYQKSEFFHDVNSHINEHLLTAGSDGMSKKSLQEATGYSESVLDQSLKYLVANGTILSVGQRRGRKYVKANLQTTEGNTNG